jgi:hypothetical protein
MKYVLFAFLTIAAFIGSALTSNAQQAYQYVSQTGGLQTVIAENATEALELSAASRMTNSGVILLGGLGGVDPANESAEVYQYVDIYGVVRLIQARNASVAIEEPPMREPNSGVMLVSPAAPVIPTGYQIPVDGTM